MIRAVVEELRAAIFDLDGLLIDSEPIWRRVEREVFAEVGVALSDDDCRSTIGLRCDAVVARWYGERPWSGATAEEVQQRIESGVCELIRAEGQPLPGIENALRVVRAAGLGLAVASSSPPAIIDAALERLAVGDRFPVRCSAAGLREGKPHPEVYLNAAEALGVMPSRCLAFEDSLPGVDAALAAGMRVVAVPDPAVDPAPFEARSALVLASLADLTTATLGL
jgi:sugar-phosphatase